MFILIFVFAEDIIYFLYGAISTFYLLCGFRRIIMRGKWNMRDWEIDLWKGVIQKHIDRLKNSKTEDEIDLTEENINPYQVGIIMKELGWESDEVEMNGWEPERWEYFSHPDCNYRICRKKYDLGERENAERPIKILTVQRGILLWLLILRASVTLRLWDTAVRVKRRL